MGKELSDIYQMINTNYHKINKKTIAKYRTNHQKLTKNLSQN